MKTRIEVDETGRFIIPIPDDIVEELDLDENEPVDWVEFEGTAILYFG